MTLMLECYFSFPAFLRVDDSVDDSEHGIVPSSSQPLHANTVGEFKRDIVRRDYA
jgi:hypothetical protein